MATRRISIIWKSGPLRGTVQVRNGALGELKTTAGRGKVKGGQFTFPSSGPCRLEASVKGAMTSPGPGATLVTIQSESEPFTFFLRDVHRETPILVSAYGVAVTMAGDRRSYEEIERDLRGRNAQTALQRINSEPEETYASAAAHTRTLKCPTWLGLSRDIRIFEVSFREQGWYSIDVVPRRHGAQLEHPQRKGGYLSYGFIFGRGIACFNKITRRLEEGCLPILHAVVEDGDVLYRITMFASLEKSPLTLESLRGTHYLVADGFGGGHMFTDKQKAEFERLCPSELNQQEETVLYMSVEAVNSGGVPRYAWANAASLQGSVQYDSKTGFHSLADSKGVFCISLLDGKPIPQSEMAILIQPGAKATFNFFIPHQPISENRAANLAESSFEERHQECRAFWLQKLASGAQVNLPEKVLDEMVKAGLLHLDIVAYGREPDGPIAPTIGVYCPIGSESSPIMQFFDSMGWHKVTERALAYFTEKQHEDGFIQNFGGYMLETGAALWSMGEHYRYTGDEAWVKRIKNNLVRACEYMLAWRRRNIREELRGRGYGLLEGKVADPPDPFHSFMLNGYAYLGMARAAEMLAKVDLKESRRWAREAAALKQDIRTAFFEARARSPVVPLGDGTWAPSAPPWAESSGPVALYAEPAHWYTHGTFTARDSLLGPIYLILQEVIDPHEQAADFLVDWHAELMCVRNVALSQPYYSRHDYAHIRRGEVKPFLKTYYNAFTGLADRETYTFWEHYFHASPHKTHEEGWFLMQTRWMLWLEDGRTLRLLPGVPRAWLEHGKQIALRNVASYFGPISLQVESKVNDCVIEATIECRSDRQPQRVAVRLPHPCGLKAVAAHGGAYCPESETVLIEEFRDSAKVVLRF